jgi:hypothetical protein
VAAPNGRGRGALAGSTRRRPVRSPGPPDDRHDNATPPSPELSPNQKALQCDTPAKSKLGVCCFDTGAEPPMEMEGDIHVEDAQAGGGA